MSKLSLNTKNIRKPTFRTKILELERDVIWNVQKYTI